MSGEGGTGTNVRGGREANGREEGTRGKWGAPETEGLGPSVCLRGEVCQGGLGERRE